MGIFDVKPDELIAKTAERLQRDKMVQPPEWAQFAKTGHSRERPPMNPLWWYVRAASVLRRIALIGPVGTQKLRVHYGGRKNKGYKPEHHYAGGGNNIRKILQQLDAAGLTKKAEKGVHKGRIVTPKGQELLSEMAKAAKPQSGASS